MELESRPDFDAVRREWDDFWAGRRAGPMVNVVVERKGVAPVPKPPYMAGAEGDCGRWVDQVLGWARSHEFLGGAVPFYQIEFAADHFALLLGAERETSDESPDTAWAMPFVEDWDRAEIRFRRDGRWWRRTVEYAERLRARTDGVVLIEPPTLVANLDALSAIRGPERFMMDLAVAPEKIHAALEAVDRAYGEILDALDDLLDFKRFGSVGRHGLYATGRTNVMQCDCSCMIGPAMFAEFAAPALRREMRRYDAVEYHLDGPGALKHLEALCAIPELDCIQWVPGAGEAEHQDWTDLFLRIDELGKGNYLPGDPDELLRLPKSLRGPKTIFKTETATRDEALRLIDELSAH